MKLKWHPAVVAMLLLAALAGGCGGGTTEPQIQVAGDYVLTRVNGDTLPYPFVATELLQGEIVGGSLHLAPDRRYRWRISVEWTLGVVTDTTQVFERTGAYEQTATGLRLVSDEGLVSDAEVDGETMVTNPQVEGIDSTIRYTFRRSPGG